jgi:hypothetical protein
MKKEPLKFKNPRSNSWRLVPDAAIQYSDKAYTASRDADRLLHRVIEEHPNTAWALQAQSELHSPFGFRWVETYVEPEEQGRQAAARPITKATPNDVKSIHFYEERCCAGYWPVHLRETYETHDTPMGPE